MEPVYIPIQTISINESQINPTGIADTATVPNSNYYHQDHCDAYYITDSGHAVTCGTGSCLKDLTDKEVRGTCLE